MTKHLLMANISSKADQLHAAVRSNKWLWYLALASRILLALGFLPSGFVKIAGERFTSLSVNHPMGNYLEALHHTGYYYTLIGIAQMTAALLLLIPRTALLGAVIYFPIILNIFLLTYSVRFEGSAVTSPLMVLANLYLLCWDYHRIRYLLPFRRFPGLPPVPSTLQNRFPFRFFAAAVVILVITFAFKAYNYRIEPHNTLPDCRKECKDSTKPAACYDFCDCIHNKGLPFNRCIELYESGIIRKP